MIVIEALTLLEQFSDPSHDGPPIRLLPAGRLGDGQKLRVSYFHGMAIHDRRPRPTSRRIVCFLIRFSSVDAGFVSSLSYGHVSLPITRSP